MGKTVPVTQSITETNSSDEAAESSSKNFSGILSPSRLSAPLSRSSEYVEFFFFVERVCGIVLQIQGPKLER